MGSLVDNPRLRGQSQGSHAALTSNQPLANHLRGTQQTDVHRETSRKTFGSGNNHRKNSAQNHRGTRMDSEPRIESFREGRVEGVEVNQDVVGHSVEGQDAGRMVHIHRYYVRGGGAGGGDGGVSVSVPHNKTFIVGEVQTPGLVVLSKQTVTAVSFPSDPSVTHRDTKVSFGLDLPVRTARQSVSTQQLGIHIKPVWMVGVRLALPVERHLPVAVTQFEGPVDGVCVDCELTGV